MSGFGLKVFADPFDFRFWAAYLTSMVPLNSLFSGSL